METQVDSSLYSVRRCPTDFFHSLEVHASSFLGQPGIWNRETGVGILD